MSERGVMQCRTLTASKTAVCAGCGATIPPGMRYVHTFSSGFVTKRCLPCDANEREEQVARDEDEILDSMPDTAWGASDGGGWT